MKFKFLLLGLIFSLISCKNSKEELEGKTFDPIQLSMDRNADALLADSKIHAVSIGVYKDGRKYIRHYGQLDEGKENKPTDNTIYEIASVSKTLTGVLVAKAVLEKKLHLEEDIRTYLKVDYSNFQYKGHPIKLKHLITHTSGLPAFLPESLNDLMSDFNESLPFNMSEIQERYSKKAFFKDLHSVELDTLPGTTYRYSNVDTELVAHILENVYHMPFEELLRSYFRAAAHMHNTKISLTKNENEQLANGYGMTNKLVPHEPVPLYGAGGGVKATMPDLVNYMEFQLDSTNKIVAESHRVIYRNGHREMAYYWPLKNNDEYGTYLSHHGGAFGSQNWFFIIPTYNVGISVITNQSDLDTPAKLMKVVKGLIKDLQYKGGTTGYTK